MMAEFTVYETLVHVVAILGTTLLILMTGLFIVNKVIK